MLAFAEFERDMIAERTREKLYSQAQRGYWGGGTAQLGYDVEEKKLIVNATEADLVRRIFQYYLQAPSSVKVAIRLNGEGYRTKTRTSKAGKVTGGGPFSAGTIKGILRNKVFVGSITFNKETFKGLHEPILDEALFKRVQSRMDESIKDRYATYVSDSPLTLLGITFCGICGSQLTTSFTTKKETGKKYYYYKCTKATKSGKTVCNAKDLKADDVERFVRKLVGHLGSDTELFNAVMEQVKDNSSSDRIIKEQELEEIGSNLGRITKELGSLVTKLTQFEDLKNSSIVVEKIKELEKNKADLEQRKTEQAKAVELMKNLSIDRGELRGIFKNFAEIYESLPIDLKRRFNQALFVEIRSFLKSSQKDGELQIKIRANGTLKYAWDQIVNPETSGSSLRGLWLHRRDSNLQPSG